VQVFNKNVKEKKSAFSLEAVTIRARISAQTSEA